MNGDNERCTSIVTFSGVRVWCQLDKGHGGEHSYTERVRGQRRTITWEKWNAPGRPRRDKQPDPS